MKTGIYTKETKMFDGSIITDTYYVWRIMKKTIEVTNDRNSTNGWEIKGEKKCRFSLKGLERMIPSMKFREFKNA